MLAQLAQATQRGRQREGEKERDTYRSVGRVKLHASFVASLAARRLQPFCCFCVSSVHMTTTMCNNNKNNNNDMKSKVNGIGK